MTTGGWLIMIASIGAVTVLFGWCIWKVIATPNEAERLHGFEIETPDEAAEHHDADKRP